MGQGVGGQNSRSIWYIGLPAVIKKMIYTVTVFFKDSFSVCNGHNRLITLANNLRMTATLASGNSWRCTDHGGNVHWQVDDTRRLYVYAGSEGR